MNRLIWQWRTRRPNGDSALANEASAQAKATSAEIENHFYDKTDDFYAFSRNTMARSITPPLFIQPSLGGTALAGQATPC